MEDPIEKFNLAQSRFWDAVSANYKTVAAEQLDIMETIARRFRHPTDQMRLDIKLAKDYINRWV